MSNATNNRFYREEASVPYSGSGGTYRDDCNNTADYDNGYRAAVRLARVLMEKHFPEATGWEPAPDLLGVITQIDHLTAHLLGCFPGPPPEQTLVLSCTCHPDDRPAGVCPQRFAATECQTCSGAGEVGYAPDDYSSCPSCNSLVDQVEAEREACIRILEDMRPRNAPDDWNEFTVTTDTILRLRLRLSIGGIRHEQCHLILRRLPHC